MIKRIAATLAGVIVVATLAAGQAHASNGWICDTLERHPNKTGVLQVISELIAQGYTADNGGAELFAQTVISQCPDMIPVVQDAVSQIA